MSGCLNVVSPVGCILTLFYVCAFQMNPVSVFTYCICLGQRSQV